MLQFFRRIFAPAVLLLSFFVFPNTSFAQTSASVATGYANIMQQGIIFANICPSPAPEDGQGDTCQCRAQGICSLSQVTQLAVNGIIFLLGISGSVALCMFVYGGWNWVFAQGREGYISTGKDTMKNALIGLAIIFGAYALINLTLALIGGITPGATIEDTIQGIPATEHGARETIETEGVLDTN